MHQRPDPATYLDGVVRFLSEEVVPAVDDPAVVHRLKIACWLLGTLADQWVRQEQLELAELERLEDVLEATRIRPLGTDSRRERIRALNRDLARLVQDATLDERDRALLLSHLQQTLLEELAVTQPRFATTPIVE